MRLPHYQRSESHTVSVLNSPDIISLLTKTSLPAEVERVLRVGLQGFLLHIEDQTVGQGQGGLAAPSLHCAPLHFPSHVGVQEVGVLVQEGLHLQSDQGSLAMFMLNSHFVKFIRKIFIYIEAVTI